MGKNCFLFQGVESSAFYYFNFLPRCYCTENKGELAITLAKRILIM